jgi:hypothetical protein
VADIKHDLKGLTGAFIPTVFEGTELADHCLAYRLVQEGGESKSVVVKDMARPRDDVCTCSCPLTVWVVVNEDMHATSQRCPSEIPGSG